MKDPGRGALSESDGRCFMALLDMCHFLVDQITQRHCFPDVQAASSLRAMDTLASAHLTAEMYSYWYAAPAGPGIFEMLVDWTQSQPGVGVANRNARQLGQRVPSAQGFGAALHALARNECAHWPRRRKTGVYYYGGDDSDGVALVADELLTQVYRVVGISTSLGDMMRANQGEAPIGSALLLTLLPFMGGIVYDGTIRGAPRPDDPAFVNQLMSLVAAARKSGDLIRELPTVVETPLLGKRVVVNGLQAKPELNGRHGIASDFVESKGRYAVNLEDGGGSFALKPDNLSVAPPRSDEGAHAAAAPVLSAEELALQEQIRGLREVDDFWVFRRMGYSEADNPMHMGMIMSGESGMVVGQFKSRQLAPTAAEYLSALKDVLFRRGAAGCKPKRLAVDEKSAVERLRLVLLPAGVEAGYYPPPSDEELSSMGVDHRHGM